MRRAKEEITMRGITLVALVVTIVVLLILAGITITYVMGDNSVFKQAQNAKLQTEIAKAREKLEVTFGNAKLLKHTDNNYDQDDYLDELMEKEIPNIKIQEDIAIVDGYAFEINRNEPKIGQYIGQEKELAFPEVTATVTLAEDKETATIHIIAKEETNGINKIEVIQDGYVLETYECGNSKEEITKDYIAKRNGAYTIKVYAEQKGIEKVKVEGIITLVKYSPNGSKEYKKEHSVKVSVGENPEKIKNMKYQWLPTTVEPAVDTFTESCNNDATITGKDYTGTYYLWILLETEDNKKKIERSEAFRFDNEGPITELTTKPVSETSFTLTATATDTYSEIAKYEFYIDGKLENTQTTTKETAEYIWNGTEMAEKECYVIVTDKLGNTSKKIVTGKTIMYAWEKWSCNEQKEYQEVLTHKNLDRRWVEPFDNILVYRTYSIDSNGFVHFDISTTKSLSSGSWEGYYTPLPPNKSYTQGSELKEIYKMKNCVVSWNTFDQRQAYVYYDCYKVEEVTTYSKGEESLGYVTSLNPNQYEDNKRNEDGYWYMKVDNR